MTLRLANLRSLLVLATFAFIAPAALLAAEKKPVHDPDAFGSLQTPTLNKARGQAQDWLKAAGKMDQDTQKAFAEI